MNPIKIVSMLFLNLLVCPVYADMPVVYFITTNNFHINNSDVAKQSGFELRVLNLDAHLNLEAELSKGLPQNNIEEAERIATERLEKMDWRELQAAFQGMALASNWDIRKAPAFVFNEGKFVIYGVTDTHDAMNRYLAYQSRQLRCKPGQRC